MKQFGKVLKFELKNYIKNKAFIGTTLFFVLVITVVMFLPRIIDGVRSDTDSTSEDREILLIAGDYASAEMQEIFSAAFPDYDVVCSRDDVESVKEQIVSGKAEGAFVLDSLTSYTYYVNDLSMYDDTTEVVDMLLQKVYQMSLLTEKGLSPEEVQSVLTAAVSGEVVSLGNDQSQSFLYTYIMIFALYMVIILYGSMIASGVATEKSSRAMELLVTSVDPTTMIVAKVIAPCISGLMQLAAIFGSALLFFQINKSYWGGDEIDVIIRSVFDIPAGLFAYMLVFFLLGFLIYAFLFGAAGSIVSKLEDVGTASQPITLLFVAGFFVTIFSMSSGNVDNMVIKICSFIPFTSPMAMFTRIAMGSVPPLSIAVSIAILAVSALGVAALSAKIYRMGVLLYGNKPKLGTILKLIFKK